MIMAPQQGEWPPRTLYRILDKASRLLGAREPLCWLAIGSKATGIRPCEVAGRSYVVLIGPDDMADARRIGRGTLSFGGDDTDVALTEVTDPGLKHQIVLADGEHRNQNPPPLLARLGLWGGTTPEELAATVPRVAVFELGRA
jgi:hypothetical protein